MALIDDALNVGTTIRYLARRLYDVGAGEVRLYVLARRDNPERLDLAREGIELNAQEPTCSEDDYRSAARRRARA